MIRQKMQSSSGATLIVALVFFVICAAVGAVFLAAGSSAIGSISQKEQMDQRYYAVNSAAELLEERIAGCSVIGTFTVVKGEVDEVSFSYEPHGEGYEDNNMMASFLMALVKKQYGLDAEERVYGSGSVSIQVAFPENTITDVEGYKLSALAQLEMKETEGAGDSASGVEKLTDCYDHEFDLYFILSNKENASDTGNFTNMDTDSDHYYVNLILNSKVTLVSVETATASNGTEERVYTLEISWSNGEIREK